MDQKKVGEFLKELRKEKGITQEKFAEHLNVSARSVSRWETGNNMPDIGLLVDIADYYDVDVREIIEGEKKSEMMNEEIREVANKMADYAGTEKGKLFRWVRVISFIGTILITIAIALQCINYEPNLWRFGAVVLSFLGLIAMAITTLYANGVLAKLFKKKRFASAVKIAVIILVAISVKYILLNIFIVGIGIYDNAKQYDEMTGIENFDKAFLLDKYGADLDSGFFIFPDDVDKAVDVTYESQLKTDLFDSDGSIILTATYSDEDFKDEIERLSHITCTVFETNKENSDYHIGEIQYDTESYNHPAYVSIDGYSHVYEYALIDDTNNRIVYVLLSYPDDFTSDGILYKYMDYLKKDKEAYLINGSSLERFSIYSFSFSEGVWSEYSPNDEGRELLGNPR